MIAGAVRIKVWEYMLGSLLSLVPGIFATAVFGDQLIAALDESGKVNYGAIAAAVVGLAAFLFFAKRWAVKYAT